MPIKKRGGGTVKLPAPKPKAKVSGIPKKPKIDKPTETKKVTPLKSLNIKKRGPMTSEYVYLDGGLIVVKTPKPCAKWNQEFRLRIVRDYVEPKTLKNKTDFERNFVDNGYQTAIYKVAGNRIRVVQPTQDLDGSPNHTVVLRTEIENLTTGKKITLKHKDPAMRILIVFCFLTGERPGGVPKLNIADITSG